MSENSSGPDQRLVSVTDLLRHLWRRRYVIVFAPAALVVVTYLFLKFIAGETFQSTALILVRPPAAELRIGPNLGGIEIPAYKDILMNDELLRTVVDGARGRFGEDLADAKFEVLKKNFSVRVVTTRDTSVQTTFSPVLELTAKGPSPEAALSMTEDWLANAIANYSTLFSERMGGVADSAGGKVAAIQQRLEEARRREQELTRRLDLLSNAIIGKYRLLDSRMSPQNQPTSTIALGPMASMNLDVAPDQQGSSFFPREFAARGLFAEQVRMNLQIAELEGRGPSGSPVDLAGLRKRLEVSNELIEQIGKDIEEMGNRAAQVEGELEAARAELMVQQAALDEIKQIAARATADRAATAGAADAGDFRILARPVLPEKRVGLSRVLLAVGAGAAFFVFLLILFAAEIALSRLLQYEREA